MISESKIETIIQGFQKCTLPKVEWTHQAHLITGLFYITTEGFENSIGLMRDGVKSYNLSVGGENTDSAGYHETITIFFLHALKAFQQKHQKHQSFTELVNDLDGGLLMQRKFMLQFYSKELLFSVEARRDWVEPNIQPLDKLNEISFLTNQLLQ